MSHARCRPDHNGECDLCIDEAMDEARRIVRSARGRWLAVYEDGGAVRHSSKSRARAAVAELAGIGVPGRLIRYRRDRVYFDPDMPSLVVNDARWLP